MKTFFKRKSLKGTTGSSLSLQSSEGSINNIGSVPYTVNVKQLSPFFKSVWKNEIDKVRKKMKKNYNIIDKEKRSALHIAAAKGHYIIMRDLLENYKNELLELKDNNGKTAIYKSVEQGDIDCVKYLLINGANSQCIDNKGNGLVHAAIKYKHGTVLRYLLESQLDPDLQNSNGSLPLHKCAKQNYICGLNLLLQYSKADINLQNNKGKTALICATEFGNTECVKILLEHHADRSIEDSNGHTAEYYAEYFDYSECLDQLQSNARPQNDNISSTHQQKSTPEPINDKSHSTIDNADSAGDIIDQTHNHSTSGNKTSSPKTIVMPQFILSEFNGDSKDGSRKPKAKSDPQKSIPKYVKNDIDSINSDNSWQDPSLDEDSIPELHSERKIGNYNDISTPSSSMPNPSQSNSAVRATYKHNSGPMRSGVAAAVTDAGADDEDVESVWSNNDIPESPPPQLNHSVVQPYQSSHIEGSMKLDKTVDLINKKDLGDEEWDSDTTMDNQDTKADLSVIDEESGHIKILTLSDATSPGKNINRQSDMSRVISTNPPVRYDSSDFLEDSTELNNDGNDYDNDEDTFNDLHQTIIPAHTENVYTAIQSKPPKSPGFLPVINVEHPSDCSTPTQPQRNNPSTTTKDKHHSKILAMGDNLSYASSTDLERESSLDSKGNLGDEQHAGTTNYINKCAQLQSKLRQLESQRDTLIISIDNIKLSRDKADAERLQLQQNYRKLEDQNSLKQEELSECKLKLNEAEILLNKREVQLTELREAKQRMEDKHADLERQSILNNSKLKQMQDEIEHLNDQLKSHDKNESDQLKSHYESEQMRLMEKNQALQYQLTSLENDLQTERTQISLAKQELQSKIDKLTNELNDLTIRDNTLKGDKDLLQDEVKQLKETIKHLNVDLQTSNKTEAQIAKQTKECKSLQSQLDTQTKMCSDLTKANQDLQNSVEQNKKDQQHLQAQLDIQSSELQQKTEHVKQLQIEVEQARAKSSSVENIIALKESDTLSKDNKIHELEASIQSMTDKHDNTIDQINELLDRASVEFQGKAEVTSYFHKLRKMLNSNAYDDKSPGQSPINGNTTDQLYELSQSKSQISSLQQQLDQLSTNRNAVKPSTDMSYYSMDMPSQLNYIYNQIMIEQRHISKLESSQKEYQKHSQQQSRVIHQKQQECQRLDNFNHQLNQLLNEEKSKHQILLDKEKSLSNQLRNEIKKVRHLRDVMDSVKSQLDRNNRELDYPINMNNESLREFELEELHYHPHKDTDNIHDYLMLPKLCSRLLDYLTTRNEDLRTKLRRLETSHKSIQLQQRRGSCHNLNVTSSPLLLPNHHYSCTMQSNDMPDACNSNIDLQQQQDACAEHAHLLQQLETQRHNRDKLDKIRDETEAKLRQELYQLRQKNMLEINEMLDRLAQSEKDRIAQTNEIMDLRDQLHRERRTKDALTEQLMSLVNGNLLRSQISASSQAWNNDSLTAAPGLSKSHANLAGMPAGGFVSHQPLEDNNFKPSSTSVGEVPLGSSSSHPSHDPPRNTPHAQYYSTGSYGSMANLPSKFMQDDEELRNRLRQELDKSIARHLANGRPINQLNIRDKIRSINVPPRYPTTPASWTVT